MQRFFRTVLKDGQPMVAAVKLCFIYLRLAVPSLSA
ncbi:MAG: hypothetical protein ACYTXA_00340 [Nostoc sp.]